RQETTRVAGQAQARLGCLGSGSPMTPRLRFALALVTCLAASVPAVPSTAWADEAADAAKAFEQGRKKWDAKDPAGALPFFQKAAQQSGSPNARLYVARCLRETGKLPQAYDEMAR